MKIMQDTTFLWSIFHRLVYYTCVWISSFPIHLTILLFCVSIPILAKIRDCIASYPTEIYTCYIYVLWCVSPFNTHGEVVLKIATTHVGVLLCKEVKKPTRMKAERLTGWQTSSPGMTFRQPFAHLHRVPDRTLPWAGKVFLKWFALCPMIGRMAEVWRRVRFLHDWACALLEEGSVNSASVKKTFVYTVTDRLPYIVWTSPASATFCHKRAFHCSRIYSGGHICTHVRTIHLITSCTCRYRTRWFESCPRFWPLTSLD